MRAVVWEIRNISHTATSSVNSHFFPGHDLRNLYCQSFALFDFGKNVISFWTLREIYADHKANRIFSIMHKCTSTWTWTGPQMGQITSHEESSGNGHTSPSHYLLHNCSFFPTDKWWLSLPYPAYASQADYHLFIIPPYPLPSSLSSTVRFHRMQVECGGSECKAGFSYSFIFLGMIIS